MLTGTWTPLTNVMPTNISGGQIDTMELLTDGSVMVEDYNSQAWEKLTPSASGSYTNGTWSTLASMSTERVYTETSMVLPDGRFLYVGGKYSGPSYTQNYINTGEIYNPVTDTWSNIAPFPESTFGNTPGVLLSDGTVLAGSKIGPNTYIYHPTTDTWTLGLTKPDGDPSWGESWIKLPGGGILSVDSWNNAGDVERFDPTTMTWSDAGTLPAAMQGPGTTFGPDMQLPDGRIFVTYGGYASQGNTALYDPATNTWSDGPTVPGGLFAKNTAAAMLTNGHVLFAAGSPPSGPVHLFEFDPTAPIESSLTDVSPAVTLAANSVPDTSFLALPSGQVLAVLPGAAHGQLYVYTPDGSPDAAWKPTISSVVAQGGGVYQLTGTQLNGLSVGASFNYGAEMDSNYPIVELKNTAGKVYFARTSNWSSTGVATGSTPVTTDFALPAGLPLATYQLTVIANGIASDPVSFTGGFTGADLAVTKLGPNGGSYNEGDYIPYSFTVTNIGPSAATKVVLTDTLGANLNYNSASASQGTFKRSGSTVTFSIGTLNAGQSATVTVWAQATEDGNLSDTAVVSSNTADADSTNNTAVNTAAVAEPPIVVSNPLSVSGKKQNNITVATFTHASGVEPASDFVATIDWGDGTTSTGTVSKSGSTYTVKGSHTYATNGSHTVTTTVVESEAGASSALVMALATNQATTASLQSTSTGTVLGGTPSNEAASNVDVPAATGPLRLLPAFVDHVLNEAQGKPSSTLQRAAETVTDDLLAGFFASL